MGHSGPPVDSQPWGRAPKTREHTSRAGGIPTGRGGRAPPFLKRGPEGPVRHQSRRGDLPGREEVWVGFQQLRSAAFHLPHSTTGLPWPTDRRANVRWSKSDWGGSRLVCGGPCVDRFSHTKWATRTCPLPGLQGDLRHFVHPRGPLRYHTLRRDARCARFRKPHSAARGANTHSCALPLLRPPASHAG